MADTADPLPVSREPHRNPPPSFRPQVGRPIARMRPAFALALVATAAFGLGALAWGNWARPRPIARLVAPLPPVPPRTCTALEAEEVVRSAAMSDLDRVTCLAVAGKIDRARDLLYAMDEGARAQAIADVFSLAHPIADRGDDASAGPIMGLVVEFSPNNYMAVFHAGMAEFALGHDDVAGPHLEHFMTMYTPRDVWRQRAEQALAAIAAHAALDERQAHFPE
ncbi:MAG TPA: hypothetical protein VIX73_28860 [Kofleriaceae bacterium]